LSFFSNEYSVLNDIITLIYHTWYPCVAIDIKYEIMPKVQMIRNFLNYAFLGLFRNEKALYNRVISCDLRLEAQLTLLALFKTTQRICSQKRWMKNT
ncbi:MAG: hypothetical protein ACOYIB_08215, partial [Desulfosporosinus sp.]